MSSSVAEELRNFERTDVRTAARIYVICDGRTSLAINGWTDDISAGGAKLLTQFAIDEEEVLVHLLYEGLENQLFRSRITRRSKQTLQTLRLDDLQYFVYGIEFIAIATSEDFVRCGMKPKEAACIG